MKILIATDGSKYGTAALEQACELAGNMPDSEVRIVTAYELPGPVAAEPFISAPIYTQEIVDNLSSAAEAVLACARRTVVRNCPGVPVNTTEARGNPASAIVDEASDWHADLIVVGSHGHGFWGRALLGSVSDAVVHNAPCSVMVVRST
ncbi:MAG TPA: universal stress protein [Pyrinomonadaceae bacterium]|nr:universal stress protein [Pyrinomonadaceae bacterium]